MSYRDRFRSRRVSKKSQNFDSKTEKSEIVNHFQKEGYPRRTIYDTINRMQLGGTINDKKKTGRPISWTPVSKNH